MNGHVKNNGATQESIEQIIEKINAIYSECKNIQYQTNWIEFNVPYVEFSIIKNTEERLIKMNDDLISYLPRFCVTWEQIKVTRRELIRDVEESQKLAVKLGSLYSRAGVIIRAINNLRKLI